MATEGNPEEYPELEIDETYTHLSEIDGPDSSDEDGDADADPDVEVVEADGAGTVATDVYPDAVDPEELGAKGSAIFRYLAAHPMATAKQVAEACDSSTSHVRHVAGEFYDFGPDVYRCAHCGDEFDNAGGKAQHERNCAESYTQSDDLGETDGSDDVDPVSDGPDEESVAEKLRRVADQVEDLEAAIDGDLRVRYDSATGVELRYRSDAVVMGGDGQ